MKKMWLTFALILTAGSFAHAEKRPEIYSSFRVFGTTMYQTALSGDATSDMPERKLVMAAADDIAYFVLTNGEGRTASFEKAMRAVRPLLANQQVTDMELAQALLAEIYK